MATNSEQSAAFPVSVPMPLGHAQASCVNPPVVLEQELALAIPMTPKRTRSGIGRIVSRTKPMPKPIVEIDFE